MSTGFLRGSTLWRIFFMKFTLKGTKNMVLEAVSAFVFPLAPFYISRGFPVRNKILKTFTGWGSGCSYKYSMNVVLELLGAVLFDIPCLQTKIFYDSLSFSYKTRDASSFPAAITFISQNILFVWISWYLRSDVPCILSIWTFPTWIYPEFTSSFC